MKPTIRSRHALGFHGLPCEKGGGRNTWRNLWVCIWESTCWSPYNARKLALRSRHDLGLRSGGAAPAVMHGFRVWGLGFRV